MLKFGLSMPLLMLFFYVGTCMHDLQLKSQEIGELNSFKKQLSQKIVELQKEEEDFDKLQISFDDELKRINKKIANLILEESAKKKQKHFQQDKIKISEKYAPKIIPLQKEKQIVEDKKKKIYAQKQFVTGEKHLTQQEKTFISKTKLEKEIELTNLMEQQFDILEQMIELELSTEENMITQLEKKFISEIKFEKENEMTNLIQQQFEVLEQNIELERMMKKLQRKKKQFIQLKIRKKRMQENKSNNHTISVTDLHRNEEIYFVPFEILENCLEFFLTIPQLNSVHNNTLPSRYEE